MKINPDSMLSAYRATVEGKASSQEPVARQTPSFWRYDFGVAVTAHYFNLPSWEKFFAQKPVVVEGAWECILRRGWASLLFPNKLEVLFVLRVNPAVGCSLQAG